MTVEPEIIDVEPEPPMQSASNAVARWEPSSLATMSDQQFDERLSLMLRERDRLRKVQREVLTEGSDYDVIPGTKKPSLLKPGAEVLNKMAGLVPTYPAITPTFGDGKMAPNIHYVVQCVLRVGSQEGPAKASGVGSCNSWERKYRWRKAERICPNCNKPAIIKGQAQYGGGWVCWKKKDGCGTKFAEDAPQIVDQVTGDVENPDPFDQDNTLLKMAKKRAYLDATLSEHAGSGLFTQDLEDSKREAERQSQAAARAPDDDRWDGEELDSLVKGKQRSEESPTPAGPTPKAGVSAEGLGASISTPAPVGEPTWLDDPIPNIGRKGWSRKPWRWMLEAGGDDSERWSWVSGILDSPTAAIGLKQKCEYLMDQLHRQRQARAKSASGK